MWHLSDFLYLSISLGVKGFRVFLEMIGRGDELLQLRDHRCNPLHDIAIRDFQLFHKQTANAPSRWNVIVDTSR